MPVSNNTFARQYPGDRRRDYEFPRNKRLFKRFNGENGSRRIAMSALLAGSRCSIRVVSFLIERCDPFYYSALLSSIMRPDTARYPLANAYLFYPRSTVFDVVPSPRPSLVDREQSRDVQPAFNDTNNYGVSFFGRKPGQFDCYRKLRRLGARGVPKLASNLTWRIYHRVRGSCVGKGRWRPAPSEFASIVVCSSKEAFVSF